MITRLGTKVGDCDEMRLRSGHRVGVDVPAAKIPQTAAASSSRRDATTTKRHSAEPDLGGGGGALSAAAPREPSIADRGGRRTGPTAGNSVWARRTCQNL